MAVIRIPKTAKQTMIGNCDHAPIKIRSSDALRKLQTGTVQFYALLFAIGFTVVLYALVLGGQS